MEGSGSVASTYLILRILIDTRRNARQPVVYQHRCYDGLLSVVKSSLCLCGAISMCQATSSSTGCGVSDFYRLTVYSCSGTRKLCYKNEPNRSGTCSNSIIPFMIYADDALLYSFLF